MKTPVAFLLLALTAGAAVLGGCSSSEDRAADHLARGQEFVAAGDPVRAALEFRNAIKLKENNFAAITALADLEETQGNYAAAVPLYRAVAERVPEDVHSRIRLSYIFLAAGEVAEAQKLAEEAFKTAPADPTVLVVKAAIALKGDDRGEAVRLANLALKEQPDNMEATLVLASERLLDGDAKGALALLDQAVSKDERNVAIQLLRLSALEQLGDDPAFEGVLRRLTELYPENAALRTALATWFLKEDRPDDAEAVLREYAAANAADPQAQLILVSFVRSERGTDAAASELERLIGGEGDTAVYQQTLASLLFEDGKRDEAVAILTALIKDSPDGADKNKARVQLAQMLAAMEEPVDALLLVDEVIAVDAKNVDALAVRASLRLASGQTAESIVDLITAVNEAPESPPLRGMLGEAYERNGSVELAEEQYIKLVQLNGEVPAVALRYADFLLRYGKMQQAERVLEEARIRTKGEPQVLTLLAQIKLNLGDWVGAQAIADQLREQGADRDDTADAIAAAALSGMGRHDESIAILETVSAGGNDGAGDLATLVGAYMRAGKPDVAEAALLAALDKNPKDVESLILLASVYLEQNKPALAQSTLERALEADPDGARGYVALAKYHLVVGDPEAAEEMSRAGLEKHPENPTLNLMLASLLELGQDYDGAIEVYEKMLTDDPHSTVAANNLASLLSEHRADPASLDRAYEIAMRFRTSEVPQFLDTLGWIYHLRGENPMALGLLKVAADRLGDVGPVQFHLGMTLKALDQSELAVASLSKSIALAGDVDQPYVAKARIALAELEAAQKQPEQPSN